MSFTSWLRNLRSAVAPGAGQRSLRAKTHRLGIEVLEDRYLPSTFTVLNLNDSGPDSLRAAITAANANPGADAIDFAATGTIALTSGQLDITDSLTINGPGAGALTVSGEALSRVFRVVGDPTVLIADLTVANGMTSGDVGAGIIMAGGTVTLSNCVVTGNTAVGTRDFGLGGGIGGGLYVAGGTLTLDQCTVSANDAVGVSGFWNDYYFVGHGLGGGLYVAGGMVYLNQSTVSENNARGGFGEDYSGGFAGFAQGGGIFVGGGMVSVNQSTVSGNLAAGGNGGFAYYDVYGGDAGDAEGGGIFVGGGSLDLHQSTLSNNTAAGGIGGAGYFNGFHGTGEGGGLNAQSDTYLDSFTATHTIDNSPDNIAGTYFLDGMSRLNIGDVTAVEGNDGSTAFVFTVFRSGPHDQAVSVDYATADGTATSASDYTSASGTVTIPAGQLTAPITIQVNADRIGEFLLSESFFVNLSNPTNATVPDGQGMGRITDDEPRVTISGTSGQEGNSGPRPLNFTVTLSQAYVEPVVLTYTTADGNATAGSDYQGTPGTVTIPVGQTTGTITVLVNGDRLGEANETFFVDLSGATNATIANGQGVGTIVDDEPRITINNVSKAEAKNRKTTLFTFTVSLSAASDQPVTMSFQTVNGTATTSDNDYIAKTGTLTFAPGETTKTITIEVKGDNKREANETFYLDLFGLSGNALFTKNCGIGAILNDD
jgi:hypothetical protein